MTEKIVKTITLRRDGKKPLRFDGERIGDAKRRFSRVSPIPQEAASGLEVSYEISARLFKANQTYIAGIEVYNRSAQEYVLRRGWSVGIDVLDKNTVETNRRRKVLEDLVKQIRDDDSLKSYVDDDLLAELFEDTEIGEDFVEQI
jgi:hypothetical protein